MVVISLKTSQCIYVAQFLYFFITNQPHTAHEWFRDIDDILEKLQKGVRKYTDKNYIKKYRNDIRKFLDMELIE